MTRMGLPRFFELERIGGRRRAVVESGGAVVAVCSWLGPRDAGVDIEDAAGAEAARIRGGAMAVRTYHAALASGEAVRVFGAAPRITVESDRHAATEVLVADAGDGSRTLTWSRDGAIDAVLRLLPAAGAEPWAFETPGWEEPIPVLAVLCAVEALLREEEGAADQPAR